MSNTIGSTTKKCYLAILLFIALLAGCSGYLPGLPPNYSVDSEIGKGVVIGSVGTKPLGKQWREWSRYEYHSISNPKFRGHVTSAVNWSNPFYPQPECPEDGLPEECGNLFAIVLPVGEYKFWAVSPAMDSYAADRSFTQSGWTTHLQGYQFEVKSAQVSYIGNMLSRLCGGSSYSFYGIVNIGSARAAQGGVADMYERDLPLLRKKFPQLQYSPINNETMAGLPWRWEYKNLDGVVLAVDWQSECAPPKSHN